MEINGSLQVPAALSRGMQFLVPLDRRLYGSQSRTGPIKKRKILSRVFGSVTNNKGFWIGWLDLLTPSCIICLNHNQLQQLKINDCLRLAPFSFLFSLSDRLPVYEMTRLLLDSQCGYIENIPCPAMGLCEPHRRYLFLYCCTYSALHNNGIYPIVACLFVAEYCCRFYLATGCSPRICLPGNLFIEPLSSSG
jgi:hypothetical protein